MIWENVDGDFAYLAHRTWINDLLRQSAPSASKKRFRKSVQFQSLDRSEILIAYFRDSTHMHAGLHVAKRHRRTDYGRKNAVRICPDIVIELDNPEAVRFDPNDDPGEWFLLWSHSYNIRLCRLNARGATMPNLSPYSHSIVPGGFDVTSYTTRLTPFTSLMIRVAVAPRNDMSNE